MNIPETTVVDGYHKIYECGICSCFHPWGWDGDCRDDINRYANPFEYAVRNGITEDRIIEFSMEERLTADEEGETND